MFEKWIQLVLRYSENSGIIRNSYEEIEKHYNVSKRFYHNLFHIQNLLENFDKIHEKPKNADTLLFSIWYHDIIYNPLRKDNEEKSAILAGKELKKINYDFVEIQQVKYYINRTKNHIEIEKDEDYGLKCFLDLDLLTMGSHPEVYDRNTKNIRKEYKAVPDLFFNPGRAKILEKFLESEFIYRTDYFREKYEKQARENIANELLQLKK